MSGFFLVAVYALLGATWLVIKTYGPVQSAHGDSTALLLVVLVFMGS